MNVKGIIRAILGLALLLALALGIGERIGQELPLAQTLPAQLIDAADQDVNAAIQQVIQHSNDEQVQAIANRDSSAMADTVTSDHYQELVRINQDLLDSGVTSIKLVSIEWGPIRVDGSNATATTFETWRTSLADGTSEQSRDRNDYRLVLDSSGNWKISADEHPGTGASTPPGIPDDQNTSHNWAGYAATNGTYTAVTGTWSVPHFASDGSFGVDATWVGIGGVHSRDLIQAGTQQTVSGLGRTRYEAWIELLPRSSRAVPLTVHPGDSVTVSLSEQTTDSWLIDFLNNTTGQTYQVTVPYQSSHSSVEWVEEAPSSGRGGGVLPLDNFGSVDFSAASAVQDGQTVTIAAARARAITMLGSADQPLAVPSPLSADGAGFTVARTDAAATQAVPFFPRGR